MKSILHSILVIMLSAAISSAQLFVRPEGVAYDEESNRVFIANQGNGSIVQVVLPDSAAYFVYGYYHFQGIHLRDDMLYAAGPDGMLFGFDINTTQEEVFVQVPVLGQLGGITSDSDGDLYVVDTGGRIVRICLNDLSCSFFVETGLPCSPQDITYDEPNDRLLVVACAEGAPIQAVNLSDSTLSVVVPTIFGLMGGITQDQYHNVYVSTHFCGGRIYCYDSQFQCPPVLINSECYQPSRMCFDAENSLLFVTDPDSLLVYWITVYPTGVQEDPGCSMPKEIALLDAYPNPFNPTTVLSYKLQLAGKINISIYDLTGRMVAELVDDWRQAGEFEVVFDGADLSSGVYFIRLQTAETSQLRKILLLK